MFNYNKNICNIKDCNQNHYKLLLCKKHYNKYIINDKVKRIQQNVVNKYYGKINLLDWIRYILYWLFHHTTSFHVYYIEHFPLESLYLYHLRKRIKVKKTKPLQFIKDFDFENNIRNNTVKTFFSIEHSNTDLINYSENKEENKYLSHYIYYFLALLIIYFWGLFFLNITHLTQNIFDILITIFLICLPLVFLAKKFIKTSKIVLMDAISGEIYIKHSDNRKFINNSQRILNKIINTKESLSFLLGGMLVALIFLIQFIFENNKKDLLLDIQGILLFLLSYRLAVILVKILWENSFLLQISKRFHNSPFKINLYALDKELGLNHIKDLIRYIALYNFFVLITVFYFKQKINGIELYLYSFIIYLTFWNVKSFVHLHKLIKIIKHQFKELIKKEKNLLNNSNGTTRFNKYKFIDNLKLNIFFKMRKIKIIFLFFLPIIIDKLIDIWGSTIYEKIMLLINSHFIK